MSIRFARYFRTSPEQRAKAKAARQNRKRRQAAECAQQALDFLQENPAIADWLPAAADRGFDFAVSMADALVKYGSWTPKQLAAVERCVERDRVRAEEQVAKDAAHKDDPDALDLSSIPAGNYAVPDGETRLKVRIDKPTKGRWKGFIFVSDGAEYGQRQKYGMQKPQGVYHGKIGDQLRAIAADPEAAMAAYGHLVGRCGICNRKLEDEQSVERGIGPVCAAKAGW